MVKHLCGSGVGGEGDGCRPPSGQIVSAPSCQPFNGGLNNSFYFMSFAFHKNTFECRYFQKVGNC